MNFNSSNMSSKFLSTMFKKVNNLTWDLTSGNVGIQTNNGIATLSSDFIEAIPASEGVPAQAASVEYGITNNPFDDFGMAIPAFATQSTIEAVEVGDIVVGANEILGWVIGKNPKSLVLLDKTGFRKNYTPPKVAVLGGSALMVVKSLLGLTGGAAGLGGLQNSLLPMLMLGGDSGSLEKILPFLLFQQTQPGVAGGAAAVAPAMNPMLMMAMMGGLGGNKSGGSIDPMMLMALSGGLGGGAGGMSAMLPLLLMKEGALGSTPEEGAVGIPALKPIRR